MDSLAFYSPFPYQDSPEFPNLFRKELYCHKVVHLQGVPPEVELTPLYSNLARASGGFLNKNEDLNTAQMQADQWLDIRYDARYSQTFRHSNTRQPLHTDGSYTDQQFDVIFFFCIEQAQYGGATTFIDGTQVVELLRAVNPELLEKVCTLEVDFVKGKNLFKRSRILDLRQGNPLFNWNKFRVSPSNPAEVLDAAAAFHLFCEERIVDGGLLTPLRLLPGEAVFFHDRQVLHGRNSFWGNRCLMKGAISLTPDTA